jgi:hypothetical protein
MNHTPGALPDLPLISQKKKKKRSVPQVFSPDFRHPVAAAERRRGPSPLVRPSPSRAPELPAVSTPSLLKPTAPDPRRPHSRTSLRLQRTRAVTPRAARQPVTSLLPCSPAAVRRRIFCPRDVDPGIQQPPVSSSPSPFSIYYISAVRDLVA